MPDTACVRQSKVQDKPSSSVASHRITHHIKPHHTTSACPRTPEELTPRTSSTTTQPDCTHKRLSNGRKGKGRPQLASPSPSPTPPLPRPGPARPFYPPKRVPSYVRCFDLPLIGVDRDGPNEAVPCPPTFPPQPAGFYIRSRGAFAWPARRRRCSRSCDRRKPLS